MLSPVASRSCANHLARQASSLVQTIPATCGPQLSQSSMRFDPSTASLRTLQLSLIADTSEPSSETWLRAGIVYGGEFFRQVSWERRISEIDSGLWPTPVANDDNKSPDAHMAMKKRMKGGERNSITSLNVMVKAINQDKYSHLWPTPRSSPNENRQTKPTPSQLAGKHGMNLATAVNVWPTPTVNGNYNRKGLSKTSGDGLATAIVREGNGGQLSPDWTEWLMNWPTGWTSLEPLSDIDEWLNETASGTWWQHEHDLPRVTKGVPNRTKRLQAIGNGQVSLCAAMAWKLLTVDLS